MKRVIALILALVMGLSALALASGTGAFTGNKLGVGARALGMGSAFVAVADDATAMIWNPAGLAQLDDTRLAGMQTDLYGLGWITRRFVGASTSFSGIAVGVGVDQNVIAYPADSVSGTGAINWTESMFIGSVAANIMDVGLAGVNIKYYKGDVGSESATGFGLDVGLIINVGDMFSFGVNAIDLGGPTITWSDGVSDTVSALYKAGMAVKLAEDRLVFAGDVGFEGGSVGDVHMGMEFKVIDELALRGGATFTDGFTDSYFSVGAGINVVGLYVDVAYLLNNPGYFGDTLVLSAEFSLGDLLGE